MRMTKQKIDVLKPAFVLRRRLQAGAVRVDAGYMRRGDEMLEIYKRPQIGNVYELESQIEMVLLDAIEDLANGAPTLGANELGVAKANGRIKAYVAPFDSDAPGEIVFSVRLRQDGPALPLPESDPLAPVYVGEDDACAAIYRLIAFWAQTSKDSSKAA